jgi:hypothetical protein
MNARRRLTPGSAHTEPDTWNNAVLPLVTMRVRTHGAHVTTNSGIGMA